jgi:signal transduction histidine kinase
MVEVESITVSRAVEASEEDPTALSLLYWQRKVLSKLLRISVFLGFFAWVPSVVLSLKEQLYWVAGMDTLIFAFVVYLRFDKRLTYVTRALVVCTSCYVVGVLLLGTLGPFGGGPIWLFAFPVMTAVLVSPRAAVVTLVVNGVTLVVVGALMATGTITWAIAPDNALLKWVVIFCNFLLLNTVATVSLTAVLSGLQSTLEHERRLRRLLQAKSTALEESQQTLVKSQEIARLGSWKLFPEERTGECSDEVLRIFDLPGNTYSFESYTEVIHPDDREWCLAHLKQTDGKPWDIEHRLLSKDGRTRWVRVVGEPVLDSEGNTTYLRGIVQETTDRKIAELEREQLEVHLRQQQKLEAIGTLASGVAHEINNPINGVLNYAQLIVDRSEAGPSTTAYAREIIHEAERTAAIVKNLLSFARQDKQSHSRSRMVDIVDAVRSLIRTVIRLDQIDLQVHVAQDLPPIRCRSQQIQQVLMNLLTNARDALNERFPKSHDDKVLRVSADAVKRAGNLFVRVTVSDRGFGIEPEVLERMFDPFFTTKGRDRGTGLGLAISHSIVTEHGGRLLVESELGLGTEIHLELPADGGEQREAGGEQREAGGEQRGTGSTGALNGGRG